MTEERFVDIETKIAFLEDQVAEMNKTIYQQQQKSLAAMRGFCMNDVCCLCIS